MLSSPKRPSEVIAKLIGLAHVLRQGYLCFDVRRCTATLHVAQHLHDDLQCTTVQQGGSTSLLHATIAPLELHYKRTNSHHDVQ